MQGEQVPTEGLRNVEVTRVEEPPRVDAAFELNLGRRRDVGKVLVDQAETPVGRNAREEITRVETQLDPVRIGEVGEDVVAGDRKTGLEEVCDGEGFQRKDLGSPEGVEPVSRAQHQGVAHEHALSETREGPEGNRQPRFLGPRLKGVGVVGQTEAQRPVHAARAVRRQVFGDVDLAHFLASSGRVATSGDGCATGAFARNRSTSGPASTRVTSAPSTNAEWSAEVITPS